MKTFARIVAALPVVFALSTPLGASKAQAGETFSSQYAVSVIGIRVGKSNFRTTIDTSGYDVTGNMRASGFASLFSDMSGTVDVRGSRSASTIASSRYVAKYREDDDNKSTTIRFNNGSVSEAVNVPKKRPKGKWVAHKRGALAKTLDPITASLVPANSLRDVCNRTIPVFDGVMRANIQLRYKRMTRFRTEGYRGEAVTCRAKFQPVSGYQADKKDIIFMRDRGDIEITFAPVGDTGLFAPVSAKAQTRIGQIDVRATRFARGG